MLNTKDMLKDQSGSLRNLEDTVLRLLTMTHLEKCKALINKWHEGRALAVGLQEIYSCLQWFHKRKKDICKKETTGWHNRNLSMGIQNSITFSLTNAKIKVFYTKGELIDQSKLKY